jgi:hypothetical protein
MQEPTLSTNTVYNHGLQERVPVQYVVKPSVSTKARNRWKKVTTWLSKRAPFRSRASRVRQSSSRTIYKTESKEKNTPTQMKNISEHIEEPSSRLIRRGLKHYDSSGLPGTTDAYSKSELRLRRGRKTLSAGELYHTRQILTQMPTEQSILDSQIIHTSIESNTPATTSEYFNEVLPPIFDVRYKEYMDRRLEMLIRIKKMEEEEEEICQCLIS